MYRNAAFTSLIRRKTVLDPNRRIKSEKKHDSHSIVEEIKGWVYLKARSNGSP